MSKVTITVDEMELPTLQVALVNHRTHLSDLQEGEFADGELAIQQRQVNRLIEAVFEEVQPQLP